MKTQATDLTRQPPRSPRVRLGGYCLLARLLDKGRAALAGKSGEYNYNCPLDQRFFQFAGVKADAVKKQLAAGKGDGEILAWIKKHSTTKPSAADVVAWSAFHEARGPADVESRDYFNKLHKMSGPEREDIATWFELLDLDDYVSFGGRA